MSARGHDLDCPERVDAAPYVLGALVDAELNAYREHLAGCAACRAQVDELQLVADMLPVTAPAAAASAELRERVMATVRSEAQLLQAAGQEADRPPKPARRWRARPFSLGAGGAAVAAGIVLAIAIAIVVGSSSGGHVTVTPARISANAAGAKASLHQRDGHAELVVSGMPQPALGRIYEVWLSHGPGDAQPTNALFSVTDGGSAAVDVPNSLHGVKEVMVTSEPLGGSSQPTTSPLIRVSVPA